MKEVTNMMNTEEIAKRFLTEMKKNERTVTYLQRYLTLKAMYCE